MPAAMPAVPVAESAEPENGARQPERIADCDQVERGLRRVEVLADVRQRHVRDRQVQVRDPGDDDQRGEDEPGPLWSLRGLGGRRSHLGHHRSSAVR
jgi:hypothetical protein